jgi:DNA (cytosine-5)-methyltransferase 1
MVKGKPELRSLSFFSGCLGLDLGLEESGIKTILASEVDKSCIKTIKTNRPDLPVVGDILNYSQEEIRKASGLGKKERPTLVVGGPPCQAFSTAGKRQAFNDPRGNVFLRYVELIRELQPDYAVIENVRGLLSASLRHRPISERGKSSEPLMPEELPGSALDLVLKMLDSYGYSVSFNLYNSANYGVPQIRERVILVAGLTGKKLPYLNPTHSDDARFGLPKWVTFREAIKGLREKDMTGIQFSSERLKYFEMLGPGQYWKDLPSIELQKEALGNSYYSGGGKTGFLRRLAWNRPSPTLVTHPSMPATELGHPTKNRPLSVEEYKRIQQFPDEWRIEGSVINQYKQIGNAVPFGLGLALGNLIVRDASGKKPIHPPIGFQFSRYRNTDDRSWIREFTDKSKSALSQQLTLLDLME